MCKHKAMLYRPFDKALNDVAPDDLAQLRNVHEGWYVEYKQEVIRERDLAKSLSSFANQYGGWLFLGVKEDRTTHAADSFPGIPDAELAVAEQSLRNASKDLLHPPVFYNLRNFSGPIESIGLKRGHSIITVHIPEGPDSPYIHNDGRVYRRVGDASQPTHITDRSTFDLLAQRGERARSRLADRILWIPIVSQAEERQPFVHFTIMSDPYEVMGHWYDGSFTNFSTIMKGFRLPFDNIFSTSEGYIARQVKSGDPYYRGFTWDF